MEITTTGTNDIERPLMPKREGLIGGSIDSNMEEAVNHTSHHGVDSNSITGCDDVDSTTAEKEQNLLSRVCNSLSSIRWGMEMMAMTASFACMGALIWVLVLFQDRPLADWSFWISLNAVVAIAATAAKATLLAAMSACLSQEKWQHFSHRSHCLEDLAIIDYASRGPLGSMQMLLKVSWGFASVGAIVTILSLATDAFVQQITNYEPDIIYTLQKFSGVFSYTHGYLSGAVPTSENVSSHSITYFDWTVDTSMQAAVLKGLYEGDGDRISDISYVCYSNCTWDQDYITLGFSNTCADVTEETLATMHCPNSTDARMSNNCELHTPGGVQFSTGDYMSADDNVSYIGSDLAVAVGASDLKYGAGPVLNGSDLFRAAVWIWDDRHVDGSRIMNKVAECSLGVAIYKYSNISVVLYNFTIGATHKIPLGNNSGATLVQYSSKPALADNLLWWNDTSPDQPDIHVSLLDLVALADFFQSPSFSGGQSSTTSSGNYHPGSAAIFKGCRYLNDDDGHFMKCISGIFDQVTSSMTSQLLRRGGELAQGLTSQDVVYIRVRWVWLILPLVVQFLGGVALVVTIIGRERTKNVPLWKSSTLAVLYHSVDEHGALVACVKDPGQLDKIGKTVQAVLDQ